MVCVLVDGADGDGDDGDGVGVVGAGDLVTVDPGPGL